ncbi:MAG: hypothetical protein EP330_13945 [Deltaproteobacteria bacterium]|nr:MAG: hypothetical protein EP330_13945 [Deltaproteobacteria bacterium]
MESGLSGRFEVEGRLGAGAAGTVYAAIDRSTGAPVAIKSLHGVGPDAILEIKREFRALVDLAHPNLVQLYELLGDDGGWFFTMERIEGPGFLEWLRGGDHPAPIVDSSTFDLPLGELAEPAGPAPEPTAAAPAEVDHDRVRDGFRQLCEGVAALHRSGRLHRDLKPSNVRVTVDGRVVILDFGLVVHARDAAGGRIAGSAAYMAPEQAAGLSVGPSADLYAVGVMLYEALRGERPFTGSTAQLLQTKQHYDAPDPSGPGVPDDLAEMCRELLSRDPLARPSAEQVLERLGAATTPTVPSVFGGREAELALLRAAWREASAGRPVLVDVAGRSGIGKSALVDAFLGELGDAVILRGRCYERESVPYKAMDAVVDALAAWLVQQPEVPLDADARVAAELFPVLARVPAVATLPERTIPDAQERRAVGFAALERLVRAVAPAVLFIDDVHWGDADSGVWMSHLLATPAPILVVWTRRSEHEPGPFVEHALTGASAQRIRRSLVLDVLDPSVTRDIAARLRPDAPEALREAMVHESGGNPLFLLEMAALTEASAVASLDDAIRRRADALPEDARALLRAAALAGRPWSAGDLARAVDLADPRAAIALLRAGRFARTDDDALECHHDRVRESVAAAISEAEARRIHAGLAAALLEQPSPDPEQVALHLAGSGDRAGAAAWTFRAAERAATQLAFDHAAALYRRGLDQGAPEGERLREVRIRLGDACAAAGRAVEATDAWLAATEGAPSVQRTELRRIAAQHLFASGHVDRGHAVLAEASREVSLWVPSPRFARVLDLVWHIAVAAWRGTAFSPRAEPLPEVERLRIDLCFSAMVGLVGSDRLASAQYQARHLVAALRAGDPPRIARALAGEAVQQAFRGGEGPSQRAEELLRRARELSPGDPQFDGFIAYCAGVVAFFEDRIVDADQWLDAAERHHLDQTRPATWDLLRVRLMRVWPHFHAGRLRRMGELVQGLVHEAVERENPYAEVTALAETGFVHWLVQDEADLALGLLDAQRARWERSFDVQWYALSNARAQIALYRGDVDRAVAELDENTARLRWSMLRGIRLVRAGFGVMAGRVLCGAAAENEGSAREVLAARAYRVADAIAAEQLPAGEGQAALIRGRVAALRGEDERAVTELRRAETLLSPLGYELAAQAARRARARIEGDEAAIAAIDGWLRSEGVVDVERFATAVV